MIKLKSIINAIWNNQKIRYLLIGGYNTAFGYGMFTLLWWFFNEQLHYIEILIIGQFISVINAYLGYRLVVFRTKGAWLYEFFKFNLVYLGSFSFNLASLPLLIEKFKFHPLNAQAIIVSFTILCSYLLHSRVTFRKKPVKTSTSSTNPILKK